MVYSGNLNAYRDAVDAIRARGFTVSEDGYWSQYDMKSHATMTISDESGEVIHEDSFCHRDEDVLINMLTEWLRRMDEQLSYWR